jgi:signal transduction histidine kinase
LVRQAQGEIIVQSILGKGTTFSVYWPLMENNEGDDYGKSAYN